MLTAIVENGTTIVLIDQLLALKKDEYGKPIPDEKEKGYYQQENRVTAIVVMKKASDGRYDRIDIPFDTISHVMDEAKIIEATKASSLHECEMEEW